MIFFLNFPTFVVCAFEFIVDDVWKHRWMNGFPHIMRADIYRDIAKAPGQWLKKIYGFLFRIMIIWTIERFSNHWNIGISTDNLKDGS